MTASTSDASFPTMEIEQVDVKTELPEDYLLSEDTTDPTSEELSNQKPFKCGICGHRTTADTLLKVHMKMHFAKRMHECHVCKQTFNFVTELNTHILSHSRDVSGLRCSHCGKDCFTSEDLQRHHQRFHTNEKPFKCKLCQRSFAEEFYLRAHERSHHGEGYAKKNMMEEGTFVDPSVVKHLGEGDAVKVSAREDKNEQRAFKNSNPHAPLSNDEKVLLLKCVEEMELNKKYVEMEQIRSYLKNGWLEMAGRFKENEYNRPSDKLARTYFHLKNHAKTHVDRFYRHKKLPKPHKIDYMIFRLCQNEFDVTGVDVRQVQQDSLLYVEEAVKEEGISESDEMTFEDNSLDSSSHEEPKLPDTTSASAARKRSNEFDDDGPSGKTSKVDETVDLTELMLANEQRKQHLCEIELRHKEELFRLEKKHKEEIYRKELQIKDMEIALLRQKLRMRSGQ